MKTIFLSIPMRGRSIEDILYTRDKMISVISAMYEGEEMKFIDNINCSVDVAPEFLINGSLLYLGEAIKKMAYCDFIAYIENVYSYDEEYNGCKAEVDIAYNYNIGRIRLRESDDLKNPIYCPDLCKQVREKYEQSAKECNAECNAECNPVNCK